MSRYRGPRFKKICRLGALPGLTQKRPRARNDLRNQSRPAMNSARILGFPQNEEEERKEKLKLLIQTPIMNNFIGINKVIVNN